MKTEDTAKIIKKLNILCVLFDKEVSEPLQEAYIKILSGYPIDKICNAFDRAMVTCKFWPKPAEIIELIGGNVSDVAEVETGKVLDSIHRYGGGQTIVFDDPVTQAVIKQGFGGWIKLCSELKESEEKWFRKDFINIYKSYHKSGMKEYGKMIGYHDRDNAANFKLRKTYIGDDGAEKEMCFLQEPVYVGDESACKQIEVTPSDNNVIEYNPKLKQIVSDVG